MHPSRLVSKPFLASVLVCAAVACSGSDGASGPPALSIELPDAASPDAGPQATLEGGADADAGDTTPVPIPKTDAQGQPLDVGLLILGHSTSQQGDYPAKLAGALNADAVDGRNYQVLRTITGGDGGFLWTQPSFAPNDPGYAHVLASQVQVQYCQDNGGTRWSNRRRRLEAGIRGTDPAPAECQSSAPSAPPPMTTCVWHEGGTKHEQSNMPIAQCWAKMDVKIALIQDTTNRSWPVDDTNGDGKLDDADYFRASDIRPEAIACPAGSGMIDGFVDFNCDGKLGPEDSARRVYATWLEKLAIDLLTGFGPGNANYVFLSHKPVEAPGACPKSFPGESCGYHTPRTPTASRPFDRFFLPSVYWESAGLDLMLGKSGLDPRIKRTSSDVLAMWKRSATCYEQGIAALTIPGAPAGAIAADDTETDGAGGDSEDVGCERSDHVHHNARGGWMMADVWYAGLHPFFNAP